MPRRSQHGVRKLLRELSVSNVSCWDVLSKLWIDNLHVMPCRSCVSTVSSWDVLSGFGIDELHGMPRRSSVDKGLYQVHPDAVLHKR